MKGFLLTTIETPYEYPLTFLPSCIKFQDRLSLQNCTSQQVYDQFRILVCVINFCPYLQTTNMSILVGEIFQK